MTLEELIDLPLHGCIQLDDGTKVLRVPGGWLYTIYTDYYRTDPNIGNVQEFRPTTTFVPEPKGGN